MLWHIFQNGWEDKEFIRQRVYGMEEIRAEVAKWTPEEVERVTGVPGEQLKRVAQSSSPRRSRATLIWCMGATQKTVGTANVRAYSILLLATGNVGAPAPAPTSSAAIPTCRARPTSGLDVDHAARLLRAGRECLAALGPGLGRRLRLAAVGRFGIQGADGDARHPDHPLVRRGAMPGERKRPTPTARPMSRSPQPEGHDGLRPWRQHRHPHAGDGEGRWRSWNCWWSPTRIRPPSARSPTARDGTYLLPICTSSRWTAAAPPPTARCNGASKVVEPIFESRNDYDVMYALAQRLGFADRMFANIEVKDGARLGRGASCARSTAASGRIGYTGQSPERLQAAHAATRTDFDLTTLRGAPRAPAASRGDYLRPALALLRHAGDEASRHATSCTTPTST